MSIEIFKQPLHAVSKFLNIGEGEEEAVLLFLILELLLLT